MRVTSLKQERLDELGREMERTIDRIAAEEAKDIMEQDHAQLAWLVNHLQCIENRLDGKTTTKEDMYKYEILN